MGLSTFFRKFLGLATTIIEKVELVYMLGEQVVQLRVRPRWRNLRCGKCGRGTNRRHGVKGKERLWRHLGLAGTRLYLSCPVYRVHCTRCGVRTAAVPWARPGSMFTTLFEDEVGWFVQRTDQTATAEHFGIDWQTVGRIGQRVVAEKLDKSLLADLHFLGIDEICYGRPKKYLTTVVDHERRRVIWAAEGQDSATLERFFEELGEKEREKIQVVSIDMDAAFEKALKEKLPNAEIIYDRFHVVQLLSRAVDDVRREQTRQAPVEDRKALKGARWALLKNPWNLTPKEKGKLSTVQVTNKQIYRAYLLKETFQEIYSAPTLKKADEKFKAWYGWARRSVLKPFKKVAETMRDHWLGIRRFLQYGVTNGPVEGWNSKIRMISHRAYGFHSANSLIAMIHLCCSGIILNPVGQG